MATPFIDSEVAPVQYFHLQSHTPPPAEKTLLWLQGVNDAGPPAIDSTSEYAEETPGRTVQMLPGDAPPERHPLSPPPPPNQPVLTAPSPRKRREDPPSDWIPPSYLQPKTAEIQSGKSDSKMGLDLEYAVFGDHGAGSEASYQRTLQQAAGGYPPEQDGEDIDVEPEGDLYDDDVDSNEQERPESLMSPNNRTVPIEDPNNSRSPRYLSQSTGPSFGNINRPSSFAPMHMEKGPNVNIQIQPPTDRTQSRSGRQSGISEISEVTDPVGQVSDEMHNLWMGGSVLPPIKTQGTGTSAKWKPPPESVASETSFFRNSGGSVHASGVPITAQPTGNRVVPQSTGMTNRQSIARGAPPPVQPQMTGMTGMTGISGKQPTRGGPMAPQMTGRSTTTGTGTGRHSMGGGGRAPLQQQQTGMTSSRHSTARMQPQVTGSKSSKVIPQMTGKSGRTSMSRAGQSVAQSAPRGPGSAVGGQSTTTGRAKSPLGKSVTGGGYQSFGDLMHDPMNDGASYADEGDEGHYPGAYPGTDGNSFAGEGMAYMGEDIGRAHSVAESAHTLRGEKKLHPLAGSSVAPSEGGMHPLRSVPPSEPGGSIAPHRTGSPAGSRISHRRSASGAGGPPGADRSGTPTRSYHNHNHSHGDSTPTPSESGFIDRVPEMTERELLEVLKTPRTSYTVSPSVLAEEVSRTHYHDEDLCILLHAAEDPNQHEVIRKAVRKAATTRIKRLGIEDEKRRHEPLSIAPAPDANVAPQWARPLFDMLQDAQTRLESLEGGRNRIEAPPSPMGSHRRSDAGFDLHVGRTPVTAHGNMDASTVPSGTHVGESVLGGKTADYQHHMDDDLPDHMHEHERSVGPGTAMDRSVFGRGESVYGQEQDQSIAGGEGDLEEELYKLRVKQPPPRSEVSHNGEIPGIPDEDRDEPPPQSAISAPPDRDKALQTYQPPPVWQRVHQRLLNWAMVWPLSELDKALGSTERGHQVEEIALSVWCTQVYKRYVRARMSEGGGDASKVDRMYVPPNMADAISTAVYNGRHGDACQMLKDLWSPFGLDGMPRLIIVLARHRRDEHHWVTHRFSLPDGQLSTYDTYPEKSLPDGRPLGWWFAIRSAWPHASYPPADALVQKMVRINRPLQLLVDCSVAAAAIWRNLLMGSKAERSVDLERLRDLISTEVKSLKQRKEMGRLTVSNSRHDD